MEKKISSAVIHRMPRYFRHLCDLQDAGITRISSGTLAERMGLTASQVRQDFNCFGGFGQQGYGYNVKYLYGKISDILNDLSTIALKKYDAEEEEKTSEEAPTEGVETRGDSA